MRVVDEVGAGMNYIKEVNAFYNELEVTPLSSSAIALWHALMHICNRTGWMKEFSTSVGTLSLKSGLSERSVSNARNELKTKGFIDFKSRGGNRAAIYRLNMLSEKVSAIFADNLSGSSSDNTSDKVSDSLSDNASALLNINRNINKTNEKKMKIARMLASFFPFGISETNRYDISEFMDKIDDLELLNVAFQIAVDKKAAKKDAYVKSILQGFLNDGITTVAQYEAQEAQRQTAAGGVVFESSIHRRARANSSEPAPNSVEAFLRERGAP
jgi:DnaD/phage-associated family protein